MATLKDIVNSVLYRIDEDVTDTDEEILQVVKNGINEGYSVLASTVDQRTKDLTFTYIKGYVLPDDFVSIVNMSHSYNSNTIDLSIMDYEIIANILYIRAGDCQNGSLTMKYVFLPTTLTNDTDAISLKSIYVQALIVYAAYSYYVYRKKTEVASMFLSEFKLLTGGGSNET